MPDDEKISALLHRDAQGRTVGLAEVQRSRPVPVERVPELHALLAHGDPHVVHQAISLLAAWADPRGLLCLEDALEKRPHEGHAWAAHRLDGSDRTWEEWALALDCAAENGLAGEEVSRLLRLLLARFGTEPGGQRIAELALRRAAPALLPDLREALERARTLEREDAALALLPAIARLDPEEGWAVLQTFLPREDGAIPGPVVEALALLPGEGATEELRKLLTHEAPEVARSAREALLRRGAAASA